MIGAKPDLKPPPHPPNLWLNPLASRFVAARLFCPAQCVDEEAPIVNKLGFSHPRTRPALLCIAYIKSRRRRRPRELHHMPFCGSGVPWLARRKRISLPSRLALLVLV